MAPTLDSNGWELESAVERQRNHPSFQIPSEEERSHLRVGDRAKLLFLLAAEDEQGCYVQCERMWIHVEQVADTTYVGVLESEPVTSNVLRAGDRVPFGPEHVAAISVDATNPQQ